MLVAILTDVHGNLAALQAVLEDAHRQGPDLYVFGGDLAANGPRPAETLDLINALGASSVMGNMDGAVLAADNPVTAWASQQIGPGRLAFLRSMPFSQRITPPGGESPRDDLLLVHSTPRDFNDLLILSIPQAGTNFTRTTPPGEAEAMLAGAKARRILYGHIHYYSDGTIDSQRVTSIGSVDFLSTVTRGLHMPWSSGTVKTGRSVRYGLNTITKAWRRISSAAGYPSRNAMPA